MNEKQRYQRLLHTGYDDEDEEGILADGVVSLDGAVILGSLNDTMTGQPSTTRRGPKRQGSHGSLASYRSLASGGEDEIVVINSFQNNNDTSYEDAPPGLDDMLGEHDDESAPFRGSFDQDDQDDQQPQSVFEPSDPQLPSAILKGSSNSNTNTLISSVRSPMQKSAYPAFAYSGSLDLDDDDDDDELDLKRYNLAFSISNTDRQTMMSPYSQHGPGNSANGSNGLASLSQSGPNSLSWLAYVWYSFQSLRQQARQRRAQRLLQQSERSIRQTIWICVMTYCDATDRGIFLVAALMVAWSLLVYFASSETLKRWVVVTGICIFALRFSARPLIGYLQQRTSRRRRLKELQKNQQLQQQQQQQQQQPQRLRGVKEDEERGARTPPGRYLDRPNLETNHSNERLDRAFADEPSSEHFELTPMRRRSNSNTSNGSSSSLHGPTMPSLLLTPRRTRSASPAQSDPAIHSV
jgi:hypothetical protein